MGIPTRSITRQVHCDCFSPSPTTGSEARRKKIANWLTAYIPT